MIVQKYGGSSVENAEKIKHVAQIAVTHAQGGALALVLSAMKGITDLLLKAAADAEGGFLSYKGSLEEVSLRHKEAVGDLVSEGPLRDQLMETVVGMIQDLKDILHGVELVKECSRRTLDLIAGFGERLSCILMAAHLRSRGVPAEYFDAGQNLIITDDNHGSAAVNFEKTNANLKARVAPFPGIAVITGYIASTAEGRPTTLGRNGSDYTASIVGAGIAAESVEIWKDVDGVLTADPRVVKTAQVIDEVSLEEAMELSYFGAKVIHPSTMLPLVEKNIPLRIKNTMNPTTKGTLIAKDIRRHSRAITGIASISGVSLINIEGGGMMGIPGFASRVFSALASVRVNIIMITQASSEHSLCLVCRESEAPLALDALGRELRLELNSRLIKDFEHRRDLEIIAVIGENMRGQPGLTGKLFSALGAQSINVLAIAQGSSERNISFVISKKDRDLALNTVHSTFIDSPGEKA